jgi:WD40 repeat protein
MQDPENDFSPLLVDQQIDYPTTSLPHGEAHLIHDLQAMYDQENNTAIDRVWMRLTYQQPETRAFPQSRQSAKNISPIKQRDTNPVQRAREPRQASAFVRRLSLLAALLVVTLLVGSLTLVFTLTRGGTATGMPFNPASGWGKVAHVQIMRDFGFNGLAWSPNNKRIAASNRTAVSGNYVRIWDAITGQHPVNVPVANFVNTISWSPNGQQVAITTGQNVIIVDGQDGRVLHTFTPQLQPSAFASSGVVLLSSRFPTSGGPEFRDVTWSPDGTQVAASFFGDYTGSSVLVWNLQNGALDFRLPTKSDNGIEGISWSSDGKYIAADIFLPGPDPLSQSGVVVWNVTTHQMVLQKNIGSLPDVNMAVAWQPGTQNLAQIGVVKSGSGYTTAILIFDGTTGKMLKKLVVPVSDVLIWSPDGKYLAYTSPANLEKGNTAQILAASNWSIVYTYKNDTNSINELAWSPNGHYIATGETVIENNTATGIVRVWETLD